MKSVLEMREAVKARVDEMDDFRVRALYYHEVMSQEERAEFLEMHLCCYEECVLEVERCNLGGSICDRSFIVGKYVKKA